MLKSFVYFCLSLFSNLFPLIGGNYEMTESKLKDYNPLVFYKFYLYEGIRFISKNKLEIFLKLI